MKTILLHNTKGGIGKTTITKAIAEVLASQGSKILILDCDGQGNITSKFGLDKSTSYSKYWFTRQKKADIDQYIKDFLPQTIESTNNPNIDLVSGGKDIYENIKIIESQVAPEKVLGLNLLKFNNEFKNKYDYVFIDLNPSWDILTINSYLAADSIISIIDRTEDAITSLIENLQEWEEKVESYEVDNKLNAVLLNRIKADKMSKEILKACKVELLKDLKLIIFIPESANVEKSVVKGGKSVVDVKTFDNWKPSKAFAKWLNENEIKYKEGNPFINVVEELKERDVL